MRVKTSWESEPIEESYYHQSLLIPGVLRLLGTQESLLDLGCGRGILAQHLPRSVHYVGIDLFPNKGRQFLVADVTKPLPLEKRDFSSACFLLSLQNMADPESALRQARSHLRAGGILLLILNHPCFRIPRQSSWGIDEARKLQFRRIDRYLSPLTIPIRMHPGKNKSITYSFHHSLSDLMRYLKKAGFVLTDLEEWCSDKKSTGSRARQEDRARREIPLFLTLVARAE